MERQKILGLAKLARDASIGMQMAIRMNMKDAGERTVTKSAIALLPGTDQQIEAVVSAVGEIFTSARMETPITLNDRCAIEIRALFKSGADLELLSKAAEGKGDLADQKKVYLFLHDLEGRLRWTSLFPDEEPASEDRGEWGTFPYPEKTK